MKEYPSLAERPAAKTTPVMDFHSLLIQTKSDINLKALEDTEHSIITGLTVLSQDKLLLVDNWNCTMKTVDITTNTVTSRLILSSAPHDVTTLPHNYAAVTLPAANQIQIVSTKGDLSAVRIIHVVGRCYGIASTMNRLVVSYTNPGKVELLSFFGKVHVRVKPDNDGSALFELPEYVSVAREGKVQVIYVSDYKKKLCCKVITRRTGTRNKHTQEMEWIVRAYSNSRWTTPGL